MTLDTIFDLASLTKVVATTTAVMRLIEQGRIRLNDPVASFIPGFERYGKGGITIRHLLTHVSGLRPDVDLASVEGLRRRDRARARGSADVRARRALRLQRHQLLSARRHRRARERDAARSVRRARDLRAARHDRHRIQPARRKRSRIAPTERCEMIVGVAVQHAGRAAAARRGARSDGAAHGRRRRARRPVRDRARSVALRAHAAGRRDGWAAARVLSPATVAKMTSPATPAGMASVRGLGWDIDTSFSSNRGELFPIGSYGHTGFTGTSIWIDPSSEGYVIFLSSRLHPDGKGDVTPLRARVATVAAAGLARIDRDRPSADDAPRAGPDDRRTADDRHGFRHRSAAVRRSRLPLRCSRHRRPRARRLRRRSRASASAWSPITPAARADGATTIDLLHKAPGVQLVALFSPEHGIRGILDDEGAVVARRADGPADSFALRRDASADRRDAGRHRHARWSICRTSACASTPTWRRWAT